VLFAWHIENISSQFAKQVKALTLDSYICKFIIQIFFAGNLFHNSLVQQLICSKYLENKNTFLLCLNANEMVTAFKLGNFSLTGPFLVKYTQSVCRT